MYFRGSSAVPIIHNITTIIESSHIDSSPMEYIRHLRENNSYVPTDHYLYYLVVLLLALGCIRLAITIADDTVALTKKYTPHIKPLEITTPNDNIPPLDSSVSTSIKQAEYTITPVVNINYGKHTTLHVIRSINSMSKMQQEYKE